MKIWNKNWECASRQELRDHQEERLTEQVRYVYQRVPYYCQRMEQKGLQPSDIKSLDDLQLLPFTDKQDFMDNYPYGMLAVPLRKIVRIHGSSGTTTGKSTIVGYTARDIDTWTELVARVATAGGVGPDDIVQICFSYGLFTGGFGLHYGLERIGATVLPLASANTDKHIQFINDFGTTALVGTPCYGLYIGEKAREKGIDLAQSSLRWGLFGAEPWSAAVRREIEKLLGITATDNYGLSEIMGPGVSGECLCRQGLHIFEDHFIVEVIDPETGQLLPPGETGELVFTTLTKEAVPLIRYRTRDLASLDFSPCKCGRTTVRMSRLKGRTDDMIIVRGVNVFPTQVESALLEIEHTEPHYQIVLDKNGPLDIMEVRVEVVNEIFYDEVRRLKSLEEEIRTKLKNVLGIEPRVKLVEPKSLQRFKGKAQHVIDRREKNQP